MKMAFVYLVYLHICLSCLLAHFFILFTCTFFHLVYLHICLSCLLAHFYQTMASRWYDKINIRRKETVVVKC